MECIILAGGKGTRLGMNIPKALVKINDKTIIDYRIKHLKKMGITRFILAVGFKKKKIKEYLEGKYDDVDIVYADENENKLLGTAGAIKNALQYVYDDDVFVTNVDDITDIDIKKLKNIGSNTICLANFRSPYGIVETTGNWVSGFKEKPVLNNLWASCGFYYLNKYNIEFPEEGSIEYDIFPYINLKCHKHKGEWVTVNTLKDIEEAKQCLK